MSPRAYGVVRRPAGELGVGALGREEVPHVGVVLPTREALRAGTPALVARFGEAAEAAGLDSVWAGDSLLARPLFDPFTVLATVGARTERVLLGTGALLAPLRHPVLAAQALASLDQLSGGRLIVGVGRGLDLPETRREFAAAGVPFEQRSRLLDEAVALWRDLWASGPDAVVDRAGHYGVLEHVEFQPRPVGQAPPPVWLAGFGPAAFRRTARLADGWLPYPPTALQYREGWEAITGQAAGRDPDRITPALMATVAIGDPVSSQEMLERYVPTFYGYPLEIVSLLQACRAGPAATIVDWLREYWEAGARAFVIRLGSLDAPLRQLELLAGGVLAALRRWGDGGRARSPGRHKEVVA